MSFTLFPEFPAEIRLKIWKEVCHITRVLDLWPEQLNHDQDHRNGTRSNKIIFRTRSPPPAILFVSHEARIVGLQNYKLFFGTHFHRGLGGGPLFLSEKPTIYVNWNSDIICPMFDSPILIRHEGFSVSEFVLGFLSRLAYFRIAIQSELVERFEQKFGHELAFSRQNKEVIVFSKPRVFFTDERFSSKKPALLKFGSPEEEGLRREEALGLDMAVGYLEEKIKRNRERCPALASPSPPIIMPVVIGFVE